MRAAPDTPGCYDYIETTTNIKGLDVPEEIMVRPQTAMLLDIGKGRSKPLTPRNP